MTGDGCLGRKFNIQGNFIEQILDINSFAVYERINIKMRFRDEDLQYIKNNPLVSKSSKP